MISRFRKRGQIASFMIAVIVILLIGMMVTVNLGKVAMNKTHTANAADAGALAGSSGYNSTLNNLAYQNWLMVTSYLGEAIIFLWPMSVCNEWMRYLEWRIYWRLAVVEFWLMWEAGEDGYEEARNSARQLALVNVGIDQPKADRETGESYKEWLTKKSEFEEYMEDEDYKEKDSSTIYYNWTDQKKYGQSDSAGKNSVKVEVHGPYFPGLYPQTMVLVGLFSYKIPPPVPCGDCNLLCAATLLVYNACLKKIGLASMALMGPATIACHVGCCTCSTYVTTENPGGLVGGRYFFPSGAICGMTVWDIGLYTVPIAYAFDIIDDDPEIEVTVTRKEPRINLGLWRMNYDDPNQTGQGITSSARAKTSGGKVGGPNPKQSYDSHLIEVSK